jgi:cell fate (sporulation/competence/biofilm development) regulator YlbF (YheA/YmcA/DUF963 family)
MKKKEVSRPRIVSESEHVIQHGIEKTRQRAPRKLIKTRKLGSAVRPSKKGTGLIQHCEKKFPTGRTVTEKEPKSVSGLEAREFVTRIAWAALIVSLVALVLLGVYSLRKFSPEFEFQDFQTTQKQVVADVNALKFTIQLEKVKSTIMNARTQWLLYKDYAAAESMLTTAQQEMKTLLGFLPAEKKNELKQTLSELEKIIQEIRRGPLSLDERFKEISLKLDQM